MTPIHSPGAQPLATTTPLPAPAREAPRDAPPAPSLPSLPLVGFVAIVMIGILAALLLPAYSTAIRHGKLASDVSNLKQLWTMQANYMATFGAQGGGKLMPPDTGSEFWTRLTKTSPPLIDPSLGDIYDCPLSPAPGSVDHGEYRGPASDVNTYGDADPVGADIDGNHGPGQGGIVLRKSGDAMNYPATDPLWQAAAERTAP